MSKGLRAITGIAMVVVGVVTGQPWLISTGATLTLGAITEPSLKGVTRQQELRAMVRSAVEPQEVLYGRVPRKGGVVSWFDTSGAENQYLWYVVTVCEHEIDGYEKLWIDDKAIDIATEVNVDGFVTKADFVNSDGDNLVKCGFYTGTDDQTADAELVANHTEWTTNHRGRGVAYFWVRLELDKSSGGTDPDTPEVNVWNGGAPRELSVTVRGKKVYDPRLDSTNGGTGAHRLADASTWAWSENPILQRADYLRSSRFGPGFADTEIDWVDVAAQADVCDALVSLPDAAEQKRYTSHGVVIVSDTPKQIVESMQSADHGHTIILADGVHLRAGAWAATTHVVDESWLAGSFGVTSATETDAAYNAVRGRYLNTTGQQVEFQSKTSSAYETEDGGFRSWRDIDLPWVTDEFQAQRLAIIELKKSRQQTTATLTCNYRGDVVQVWDTLALNIGEASYSGKTFRVVGKVIAQDGIVTLSLREEAESDWTYTVPDLATPPVIPTVTRNPAGILAPSGLAAASAPDGVRLTWTLPNMSAVSHIEVYASADNNRANATLVTRTASESFIHALAASTTRYYWILARGYNGLTSAWIPAGATDGVAGTAGAAGQGPPGDPGADAIEGFASVDGAAAWVRDQDGSTWNPVATTSDIDWTFSIGGTAVGRISRRVTRDSAGLLTVSTTTHPAGDLNTSRVTIVVTGSGTRAVTVRATYSHDGHVSAVTQGISAALSGEDGAAGLSVAEVYTFRRASSAPATPTGGSYSFDTQTLTPPSGWSAGVPAGADPVYVSVTSASVSGTTGADNSLTWSAPVLVFQNGAPGDPGEAGQDGSSVDIIFRRSATQPATPTPSSTTPASWYSDVGSVPAGVDPIWSSIGTRPDLSTNFAWQSPIRVEGVDGDPGADGRAVAELLVYQRATSTPAAPSGGSYNFGTQTLTAPVGWSSDVPAGANPVYIARGVASVIGQTGTDTPSWGSPVLAFQNGEDGAPGDPGDAGLSVVDITVYRRSASVPAAPSGGSYNFGTQTLTAPANWSASIPAGTDPVYASIGSASVVGQTGTDTPSWGSPARVFQDGEAGSPGLSVAELLIYRRASSTPATPTGGSYSFTTQTLTAPSGWSSAIPAGTDPVYTSRTVAAISGVSGTDSSLTWSAAVRSFEDGQDGSSVDMVFRRSAAQPATPASSSGVPAGWYTDVNSVPAGADPIWSSVGTRPNASTNWTWQTPIKIEGQDGEDGAPGAPGQSVAELQVYRRATSTPATPSGGSFNFGTQVLTPPSGWSVGIPAGTDPVYMARGSAAIVGQTGTDTPSWAAPALAFQDGEDGSPGSPGSPGAPGDDGLSVANLSIFRRATSTPATPSGGSFNFGTQVLTPPSGWSLTIPTGTDPVYLSNGIASVVGNTGTDTPSWGAAARAYEDGAPGAPGSPGAPGDDGFSIAEIYCYRRASSAPATPTGGSFSFSTNTLTPPSGWSASVPAGTDPCYVSITTAAVQGGTGVDSSLTWTTPVVAFENGAPGSPGSPGSDGTSVAIVRCYRRATSAPSTPSGGSFNFGFLTLVPPSGWSVVPPSGTATLWESQATASITGTTGTDNTLSWTAPAASTGTVITNSASGTGSSLTLHNHNSDGRPITVTIDSTVTGTTTSSFGATWQLRLQRRIGVSAWTTIAVWDGSELSTFTNQGPFIWFRETEFNPDVFGIDSAAMSVVDNPGPGAIDYLLQWTRLPSVAASLSYSHSISTREA